MEHELNAPFRAVQSCAAEISPWKRQFLMVVHSPPRLVEDIFSLSLERAWDEASEQWFPIGEELHDLHCFLAGFVCKACSALNNDAAGANVAIFNEESSTGSTFRAVRLFLERRKPRTFVLENVRGLKRNQQHEEVLRQLRACHYCAVCLEMNPMRYGLPQCRDRLYFVGIRLDLVEAAGWTDAGMQDWITNLERCISSGHRKVDVDSFLLPESDSFVMAVKSQKLQQFLARHEDSGAARARRSQQKSMQKWVLKHRSVNRRVYRAACSVDNLEQFPHYAMLPDRIKDLLDCSGIAVPHNQKLLMEVSQSSCSIGHGHCLTVTPKGFVWLAHRGRSLLGREALRLQGVHIPDLSMLEDLFSDTQLHDLAGNAFCIASCMPVQLVVCLALANVSLPRQTRSARARTIDGEVDWGRPLRSKRSRFGGSETGR